MGHDDRREIFERLAALERMARSRHDERGARDHGRHHGNHRDHHHCDRDHHQGDDEFDEKRIIDTIVGLVTENMGRLLEAHQARSGSQDDGGGEKRIVDLIVRLVSEHVREIVSQELDRRLARPEGGPPPPRGSSEPE